jgi:hypothetical protein
LMAERKPESVTIQKIITVKRELDRAVQARMKLSQVYCRNNSSVVVPTLISA